MGFDINVNMVLHMCPKTGKPFYYGYNKQQNNYEKIYELPTLVVPEKMCEYLVGRGHLFHAYTDHFNEEDVFDVSVEVFLNEYPPWEDVQQSDYFRDDEVDYWNEEDHEGFKRLLEWCTQQTVPFRVNWSY